MTRRITAKVPVVGYVSVEWWPKPTNQRARLMLQLLSTRRPSR